MKTKNDMKSYKSNSSVLVKITTIAVLIVVAAIPVALILANNDYGRISGIILSLLLIGTVLYFFSNSLNTIILDKERVILKKNIGHVVIPVSEISDIQELEFSNLSMTSGSYGLFGFIGRTMGGSISYVKDRKNMFRIATADKKYVLSSSNSSEIVNEIRSAMGKGE